MSINLQNATESKQGILYNYALEHEGMITKKQANDLLKHHYYANHAKYVGEVLKRMVDGRLLLRTGRGVYQINERWRGQRPAPRNQPDMPTLF